MRVTELHDRGAYVQSVHKLGGETIDRGLAAAGLQRLLQNEQLLVVRAHRELLGAGFAQWPDDTRAVRPLPRIYQLERPWNGVPLPLHTTPLDSAVIIQM